MHYLINGLSLGRGSGTRTMPVIKVEKGTVAVSRTYALYITIEIEYSFWSASYTIRFVPQNVVLGVLFTRCMRSLKTERISCVDFLGERTPRRDSRDLLF